jgi:hypothetical protein
VHFLQSSCARGVRERGRFGAHGDERVGDSSGVAADALIASGGMLAELTHFAQNCDSAPRHRECAQRLQRRLHGIRICVVSVVEHGDASQDAAG